MIPDTIEISTTEGITTRIKHVRSFLNTNDDDIVREECVKAALKAMEVCHLLTLERDDLPERMDSGVGPAGYTNAHSFTAKAR